MLINILLTILGAGYCREYFVGNIWMSFKVHFKKCIKLINQDYKDLAELVIDLHVSFIVDVVLSINRHEDVLIYISWLWLFS